MSEHYKQSQAEQKLDIIDLNDLEEQAAKVIPVGGFGYIAGGSEDEWTLRENTVAFDRRNIIPRVLTGVENPSLDTSIFGIPLKLPIIMAPCAAQGLAHARGETATAEGVAAAGTLMAQSTYSSASIADTAAAAKGSPQFFQIYLSKDWKFNEYLMDEAKRAGCKAIIATADSTLGGYREADLRNNFQFPLPMANLQAFSGGNGQGKSISEIYAAAAQRITTADIRRIAEYSGLPVIVKGIQCAEDAERAIGAGASGIYVSNHGGRQLNGGPASFEVLPDVARAVNGKVPVIFDSGIRRGSHVFKALACGADLVAVGRPVVYALALGGAQGATSVFEQLKKELSIVMQLAGTQTVSDIRGAKLVSSYPGEN
jgi:L-lactate oxidase